MLAVAPIDASDIVQLAVMEALGSAAPGLDGRPSPAAVERANRLAALLDDPVALADILREQPTQDLDDEQPTAVVPAPAPPPPIAPPAKVLAGKANAPARDLLAVAEPQFRSLLERLTRQALTRRLANGLPSAPSGMLFDDGERKELSEYLAALTATAGLASAARLRKRAARYRTFAEVQERAYNLAIFDDASWVPYEGERGGKGWRNSATGDIVYQQEKPGSPGQTASKAKESGAQPTEGSGVEDVRREGRLARHATWLEGKLDAAFGGEGSLLDRQANQIQASGGGVEEGRGVADRGKAAVTEFANKHWREMVSHFRLKFGYGEEANAAMQTLRGEIKDKVQAVRNAIQARVGTAVRGEGREDRDVARAALASRVADLTGAFRSAAATFESKYQKEIVPAQSRETRSVVDRIAAKETSGKPLTDADRADLERVQAPGRHLKVDRDEVTGRLRLYSLDRLGPNSVFHADVYDPAIKGFRGVKLPEDHPLRVAARAHAPGVPHAESSGFWAFDASDFPEASARVSDMELFEDGNWTPYEGERGGRGWKNSATGEVVYQDEKPGDSGSASGDAPDRDPAADASRAVSSASEAERTEGFRAGSSGLTAALPESDHAAASSAYAKVASADWSNPASVSAARDAAAEAMRGQPEGFFSRLGGALWSAAKEAGKYLARPALGVAIHSLGLLAAGAVMATPALAPIPILAKFALVPVAAYAARAAIKGGASLARPAFTGQWFAEEFESFAEPIPVAPLPPEEAVAYFRSLVPTLGIDPQRYGATQRRRAFTLAVATEATLVSRVQEAIARAIAEGISPDDAARDVDSILDAAGVTPRNNAYSNMVVRTNLADAARQGENDAMDLPGMSELFPVWRYDGVRDGRQGADHEQHFGKFFPAGVPFERIRGPRVYNCRCNPVRLTQDEWEDAAAGGARLSLG